MSWTVKFHDKARQELRELPESLRDDFDALFAMIERNGFSKLPKGSAKNIGDGICELRVMGRDGIARSLYVTETGAVVRILVAFVKKTEKTPRDKIKLAQKRRSELK